MVSIGNFQYTGGFRFESTTIKEYCGSYPKEYELKPGAILLVMTCQTPGGEILGIPAKVPDDGSTYLHNQRLGLVEQISQDVDLGFLYWVFLSKAFNRHLVNGATGTKILHTAPSRIESFKFVLPPVPVQKAISSIFWDLESRIELCRQMNETLEAMARALFQDWFIDFGPVRAKKTGRGLSGLMREEVANLFPDQLLELPEGGVIPDGWKHLPIADLLRWSKTTINPGEFPDEVFEHYSLPAYDEGKIPAIERGDAIKSQKFLVDPDSILVSKLNPSIARVWWPNRIGDTRAISSTEFLVAIPKNVPRSYLFEVLRSSPVRESLCGNATGTSNSHQRVRPVDIEAILFALPNEPLLKHFESVAGSMRSQILHNQQAMVRFSILRDALLPKLLSGELSIPEAMLQVEAAG